MGKKKEDPDEEVPGYDGLIDEIDQDREDLEKEAYDYAKFYEDVILTHSDFEPTPFEDLVPEDVFDSFTEDAQEYEEMTKAIKDYERSVLESFGEIRGIEFPEMIEDEEKGEESKKEPVHKIPGGIIGRLFTVRKKGWRGKVWEVTPGGAKYKDEIKEMSDKMIDSIASSKGYVVLSGKDYAVISQTKPDEKKLIEQWREKREEEKKRVEDLVDLTGLDLKSIDDIKKVKEHKIDLDQNYIRNLPENIVLYGRERMPEQNPEAFKTLGLGFLSCTIDGKIIVRDGWKDEVYPNLFTVVIGPPSTQKSSAFNILRGVVKGAVPNMIYHEDWTKEALGAEFQNNPSGMIWLDEFAQILDPNIREGYKRGVMEFLIVIYDENIYATHRIEEERNIEVEGVNASFTATIQTERFYKLVTEDDVNSGFFNRFCYVILQDRKIPPIQTRYTTRIDEHKKRITKAFREVRAAIKHIDRNFPVLMEYDDEGIEILNEWYAELDGHARHYGGIRAMSLVAVISRIYTMAKKAAIIYEVLDRVAKREKLHRDHNNEMPAYQISSENLKKGIDFANMCFKNAEYLYLRLRSTDVAVKLEKFMDIIKSPRPASIVVKGQRGDPNAFYVMRRSDLLKNSGMKLKEFEDYLNTFTAMEKLFTYDMFSSDKATRKGEFIATFDVSDLEGGEKTLQKKVKEYYTKYRKK